MNGEFASPRDAFQLVLAIAANAREIAAFRFAVLDFAPLADARSVLSEVDAPAVAGGLELREALHLPFWDGVMLAASRSDTIPTGALRAAAYHQQLVGKLSWVDVNGLDVHTLDKMSRAAAEQKRLLALTSLVRLRDDSLKHLPMLDFHTGYSEHVTRLISNCPITWCVRYDLKIREIVSFLRALFTR